VTGQDAASRVWHGSHIPLVFVVAAAENGVIGRDNALPWRLRSDMQHFRAVTMGRPVLMGRRTYLSIGKPLPGRTNIVVSRQPGFAAPGILGAPNLEHALAAARGDALRRSAESIAVIGGAEIFAQLMPVVDRIEFTQVHARPDGDTMMPPIDWSEWREVRRSEHEAGPKDSAAFTFITYERAASA
jgi:dihydrofolate reductase